MNTSGMGYKILDDRYALLECLAVSGVGEIYRGRDLELTQTEEQSSRILIHLLPNHFQLDTMDSVVEQACHLTKKLHRHWLLPILAHGKLGERHYFVLNSPDSLGAHSLMSLPSQQLPSTHKLTQQFGNLVKSKHLPDIVDSALLIMLPNQQLFLLATALIKPITALRTQYTGISLYKGSTLKRTLAVGSIMAITLSTFAVEYRGNPEMTMLIPEPASNAHNENTTLATMKENPIKATPLSASLQDTKETSTSLAMPLALQESVPALEPTLLQLTNRQLHSTGVQTVIVPIDTKQIASQSQADLGQDQKNTIPKDQAKLKTKLAKPDLSERTSAKHVLETVNPPKQSVLVANATVKQKSIESHTNLAATVEIPNAQFKVKNSQLMLTVNQLASPKSVITPAPLNIELLIERANKALTVQNFNEQDGVLFYLRKIKELNHLHPQVERLGRFVVMHQHELARDLLKRDEPKLAKTLLINSKSLMQEFNLKSLNSAQEVLEHKFNQYN